MKTIHEIAKILNAKGFRCEVIKVFNNILRIDYWGKMPDYYLNKFKDAIVEEELYDSDCGYQYSYSSKIPKGWDVL